MGEALFGTEEGMRPFDQYPGGGGQLLGKLSTDSNCRHEYGLKLHRLTGQTCCAYCGIDLVADFDRWLSLAVDHAVPKGEADRLGIPPAYSRDYINTVLACSACNTFNNRDPVPVGLQRTWSLEEFITLRDRVFAERSLKIAVRRRAEEAFFKTAWARAK